MRKSLSDLIDKTVLLEYHLPNAAKNFQKTAHSSENDHCYRVVNTNDFAEIIYNAIIEYSFNEFEIGKVDLDKLHLRALLTRIRYNERSTDAAKLKYGFYGEVALHAILYSRYSSKPLIARGIFYNPLEKSETKGYDSYHLVQNGWQTELWFGEVKFHQSYSQALKDIMANITKALSDDYLNTNILAFSNHRQSFNIQGSPIDKILAVWESDPNIKISDEIKKYRMRLIYPILLLYDANAKNEYDNSIKSVIDHIQKNYPAGTFSLTVPYSIFFILIPVHTVKTIKTQVMKWISSKKQPLS
ncbi:HamA C-terminal domain-containing protein [Chitinophaga sp. NPDC101104]|uniref:HamA C-terminal domain-containing protein n=1 Tax=Chitinophaga sp. NPDC101104 TaxID=3390561 RepID=UPI003CFBE11F